MQNMEIKLAKLCLQSRVLLMIAFKKFYPVCILKVLNLIPCSGLNGGEGPFPSLPSLLKGMAQPEAPFVFNTMYHLQYHFQLL